MAGRFVIRVDYRTGGFHYLTRDYRQDRTPRKMWLMVNGVEDATRFWTRDAAESIALVLAALDKMNCQYSVREWDGNRGRNP